MSGYALLALFSGAMVPIQAAINGRLARALGSAIWAAAVSGLLLAVLLAVVGLVVFRSGPRTDAIAAMPWWAWTGCLFGAVFLSATAALAPRLGAASMIALVMAGQVLASLALDHFGALGLAEQPADARRLAAAALLLAGAWLMHP
jgi:bacterial/archaeal transporter family-2 protein